MAKPNILIVEDEPSSMQGLGMLLQGKGYDTSIAFDGFQALEKAWAFHPTLIILDLMMPHLNGFQACRILRMRPESKDIPLIILTGRNLEGKHPDGFIEGFDHYLTKPYEPEHLLELIEGHLKNPLPS